MFSLRLALGFVFSIACFAQLSSEQTAQNLASFEQVWRTVRDRHPDRSLNGLDWQAVHDQTRPLVARARSMAEVREALRAMLAKLGASHYSIIPGEMYSAPSAPAAPELPPAFASAPATGSPAAADTPHPPAPVTEPQAAEEKTVTFGNLPEIRVTFEARELPGGVGYISFNEFLDPVSIMPRFQAAVERFMKAPGIVLDLRGNRGGIGIMAMGIAGFFIDKPGQKLGEMTMRETTLNFVVFPRAKTYQGRLAVLVDGGSASTTEILVQGLQDLGRARIFGTRTAGAALPSDIVRLPNGDRFQFAQASYTSAKGVVLEGNGVTPDVEVRGAKQALDAATAWILSR